MSILEKSEGHKNTWTTLAPDDAAADPSFQKMVKKLEGVVDGVGGGWLKKMGAFDQGDLLYLADQNESERQAEARRNDQELEAFAAFRAAADSKLEDTKKADSTTSPTAPLPRPQVKRPNLVIGTKSKVKVKVKKG
eukprot:CAMPEP_0197859692 /NCGR_PEP_ID=MMETSP1438-20131217/34481_1 /TAXON_ID=1461541 /ORGANISM="Pterosperma sp., Strain CCMP1384" /LENGTH=135 /DNA_ID=CAMNT_0043476285 /DNA_START=240 /DNA_END=643 /DNA_ORIENTATION=+